MQTRIYDSAETGIPHGWLAFGPKLTVADTTIWEEVIPVILQAGRRAAKLTSTQFWGGLRLKDKWWIYRFMPAGVGPLGRGGRTITVLFCAHDKQRFEWETIGAIANELEALAKDRGHLRAVQRFLDPSFSGQTVADSLLKTPGNRYRDSLQAALIDLMANLKEGDHKCFTMDADGRATQGTQENFSPVPDYPREPPPAPPKPISPSLPQAGKRSTSMRTFITHSIVLVLGVGLGVGGHVAYLKLNPEEKPKPERPKIYISEEDANNLLNIAEHIRPSLDGKGAKSVPPATPGQPDPFQKR